MYRRLSIIQSQIIPICQFEFRRQIGNRGNIQIGCGAAIRGKREGYFNITAPDEGTFSDDTAIYRAGQPGIRLARLWVDHGERDLFTVRVAEAHLELAVDGEQLHLVGDICQEQDSRLTGCDLGQVGIKLAADAEII